MSNEPTVTVKDSWGDDLALTRVEFVGRWRQAACDNNLFWMDPCDIWKEEIDAWRDRVAEKAGEEWDRLSRNQNGVAA